MAREPVASRTSPELDLHLLKTLVVVAEQGSFTRAASRLGVSQPALSQQMRRLETDVGARLLIRSGQGVTLTPAGQEVVEAGRPLLRSAAWLVRRARQVDAGHNSIRVGFVSGTPQVILNIVLAPDKVGWGPVSLRRLEWAEEVDDVVQGRCDVAFLHLPVRNEHLEVAPLVTQDRVAVFADGHPMARRREIRIADLTHEPIVDATFDREFWLVDPRPGGTSPQVVGPPAGSVEEMLAAVAAGLGMAITTRSVAETHARRDLAVVPILDLEPVVLGAVWLRAHYRPELQLLLKDVLAGLPRPELLPVGLGPPPAAPTR
jgi:DNA-binding transcriptional LysR family regulator